MGEPAAAVAAAGQRAGLLHLLLALLPPLLPLLPCLPFLAHPRLDPWRLLPLRWLSTPRMAALQPQPLLVALPPLLLQLH